MALGQHVPCHLRDCEIPCDARPCSSSCRTPDNARAIRDTVGRLISDVYAGKLHPRVAAGLAPLMHLQLRMLEKTEFEKRLGKLEQLMREEIMETERQVPRKKCQRRVEGGLDRNHQEIMASHACTGIARLQHGGIDSSLLATPCIYPSWNKTESSAF